jgi:hypothetical protein
MPRTPHVDSLLKNTTWVTSTYCHHTAECIAYADLDTHAAVRDTTDRHSTTMATPSSAWHSLLAAVRT